MDVYLVPVGADRYELYCEVPDEPGDVGEEASRGYFRRLVRQFKETLADAERARRHGHPEEPGGGWFSRLKGRLMRWVAESIAEQRLLWHLRRQTAATLHYPSDLDEPSAVRLMRTQLGRDFDKHRFWLAIDSLAFVASGLLMLVPGPNVLAYYFAFRLVGHYLSLRGARQGLNERWQRAARGVAAGHRARTGVARAAGSRRRGAPAPRTSGDVLRTHGGRHRQLTL